MPHLLRTKLGKFALRRSLSQIVLFGSLLCAPPALLAQAPATAPAANPTRVVGAITAVSAGAITVKTDGDGEHKVTVPDGTRLQRVAPGAKDLSSAAAIQFSDLAIGDRVLIRLSSDSTPDAPTAASVVAIAQADLAQKQQKDREDWQRRGVGGLVKSVDAASGVILITSGTASNQKTITLNTASSTVLRRYAPDSVDFDQAKPAPIDTIKPGDQLRARGTKNADGTQIAAEEVVSGSFRNIAGSISSINTTANTITLKDLATKQNVTVHIGPDAQMRKLADWAARALAASGKPAGTAGNAAPTAGATADMGNRPGGNAGPGGPAGGAAGSATAGQARSWGGASPGGAGGQASGQPGGQAGGDWAARRGAGGAGAGDPQQMISRSPAIHLSDLQKGDAVMLVSTQGTTDVTAVTLLAGVEPLLQASAATQSMLLAGWNMGTGGAEAAAAQ